MRPYININNNPFELGNTIFNKNHQYLHFFSFCNLGVFPAFSQPEAWTLFGLDTEINKYVLKNSIFLDSLVTKDPKNTS